MKGFDLFRRLDTKNEDLALSGIRSSFPSAIAKRKKAIELGQNISQQTHRHFFLEKNKTK